MPDDASAPTSADPPADASSSQYRLRVTAGPGYDPSRHMLIEPNSLIPYVIEAEDITIIYTVRIAHFTGLPSTAPATSSYFSHSPHTKDQYSISLAFIPKHDIAGDDLLFGNDFDRPIKDRLPPGFNQAFRFVKWWIDPGLEGDVYDEKPYLYGPALSSWNVLRVGDKIVDEQRHDIKAKYLIPDDVKRKFTDTILEEGADGSGQDVRTNGSVPDDAAARKKFFLTESNRHNFIFEKGRLYQSDFFNGYLDFNDFSLKLPGFNVSVIKYLSKENHELRYVLKKRGSEECLAAWMFTLVWGEEKRKDEKEDKEESVPSEAAEDDEGVD